MIDSWQLFIDNNFIEKIVTYTNIYIQKISERYKDPLDCKLTTSFEMRYPIKLLHGIEFLHGGRTNTKDLWDSDGLGSERFAASMALRCFRFLLECIRFDDINTRMERKNTDKLAAVREMMENLVNNCSKYYYPSEYMTLNEIFLLFRGRGSFRMYNPSKPCKYGLKVFSLEDAKTSYSYNVEIYPGKQRGGPYQYVSL